MANDFLNEEPTEDELWAMLPEQIGVAKVSTLIDLTHATASRNDYGNALSIADTGVEAAQGEEDELVLARALATRAHVYFHMKRYNECAEDYLRAARLFERYESLILACRGFYDASRAYYYADLNEMALDFNARAVDLAQQSEDLEAIGRCLLQKARLRDDLNQPVEEILATLMEARSSLREGQLARLVVDCDEHRMDVLTAADRFDEALEIALGALRVSDGLREVKSAYFNYMVGRLHRLTGRVQDGLRYLEKSLETNREIEDTPGVASVYAEQGRCLRELGRFDEAIELAAKAKANFDASGLDAPMFNCEMLRYTILAKAGKQEQVIDECNLWLAKNEDELERFIIGLQIAEMLLQLKRFDEMEAQLLSLELDESKHGVQSSWFTWQRLSAELSLAQGHADVARGLARMTLDAPNIRITSHENRRRLRALLGE